MLVSELVEVLTKVQQYGSDAEVVLKSLEAEGEKTFIHDIELALTGNTNTVTVSHSTQPTPPAPDDPAAPADPPAGSSAT